MSLVWTSVLLFCLKVDSLSLTGLPAPSPSHWHSALLRAGAGLEIQLREGNPGMGWSLPGVGVSSPGPWAVAAWAPAHFPQKAAPPVGKGTGRA
jgi:hypothetical protein